MRRDQFETIAGMAEHASTLVAGVERAREITGQVCTTEEYDQAARAFSEWVLASSMRGALARVIEDGRIVYEVKVITSRGTLREVVADPRLWRDALVLLGLE